MLLFCLSTGVREPGFEWSVSVSLYSENEDVKSLLFQFEVKEDFQDIPNHIST